MNTRSFLSLSSLVSSSFPSGDSGDWSKRNSNAWLRPRAVYRYSSSLGKIAGLVMGRRKRPGWLVDGEGDWLRNGDGDRD